MLKAALILAAAALAGCSFDPVPTLSKLDTEQLECPWIDDSPIVYMPESSLGCWCVYGTPHSVPDSPTSATSPCDVKASAVYCTTSGGPVRTWHKMTTANDSMRTVEVDCADIAE
jgi:hypothetical protein